MPCAIGGVNLDAKVEQTFSLLKCALLFFAVITAKIWVDISKGKSRKTLFDADSAESPFV